jgi:hypothetical protein
MRIPPGKSMLRIKGTYRSPEAVRKSHFPGETLSSYVYFLAFVPFFSINCDSAIENSNSAIENKQGIDRLRISPPPNFGQNCK